VRLEEFEEAMLESLGDLTDECKDICGEEGARPMLRLVKGVVYEGCDRCVIRALVDKLGIQSFSITYRDGRYGEYAYLETHVIEITDENAQIIPIEEFGEYLDELVEFGLLSEETAGLIREWINSLRREEGRGINN